MAYSKAKSNNNGDKTAYRRDRKAEIVKEILDYSCLWQRRGILDNSVGVATRLRAGWPRNQGLFPGMGKSFFSPA
jgi:hypothetical protein